MNQNKHPQRARRRLTAIGLVAAATLTGRGVSVAATDDGIDATRATIEKWVETRQLISQEKREWAEGREIMAARLELVQREIAALRAKVAESESGLSGADGKREELGAERDSVQEATGAVADAIAGLERRARALLPRLPEPVRTRLELVAQRLPAEGAEPKQTLSERAINVLGVLNEVDKFNREVTVSVEVRELADGSSVEVSTIYLGVGQAYYASASGDVAGAGSSTADGWRWTPDNDIAPQVLKAIAIHGNAEPAAFVQLPLRVE